MMDNIDKDEIRGAIDRLQIKHPAHFTFDLTLFDHDTDFDVIQRGIDMVAKKCQEDADINIICEMAKLYLEGVRPMVEPKHGEWIEKDYSCQTAWATCSICRKKEEQIYNESPDATEETMVICKPFCPNCGADMRKEGEENDKVD